MNKNFSPASVIGNLLFNYRSTGMNDNLISDQIISLFQFDFVSTFKDNTCVSFCEEILTVLHKICI